MKKYLLLAGALLLATPQLGLGASQTILGKSLVVTDRGDPSSRTVFVRAKERDSSDSVVGDPVANGARLELITEGDNPTRQSFELPTGMTSDGQPFWQVTPGGFKYRDRDGENGAVHKLSIKKSGGDVFTIRASVRGSTGPLDIVPPDEGTGGYMVLELLAGDRYCIQFGPESKIRNAGAARFIARSPGAEGCPSCDDAPQVPNGDGSSCADTAIGEECSAWTCEEGFVPTGTNPMCDGGSWTGTYACEVPCEAGPCILLQIEAEDIQREIDRGNAEISDLENDLRVARDALLDEQVEPDPDLDLIAALEAQIEELENELDEQRARVSDLVQRLRLVQADLDTCSSAEESCEEATFDTQSCSGGIGCGGDPCECRLRSPTCTRAPSLPFGSAGDCIGTASGESCSSWTCDPGHERVGSDPVCDGGSWTGSFACLEPCAAGSCMDVADGRRSEVDSVIDELDQTIQGSSARIRSLQEQIADEQSQPDPDEALLEALRAQIAVESAAIASANAMRVDFAWLRGRLVADADQCETEETRCETMTTLEPLSCSGSISCLLDPCGCVFD